MKVVGFIGQLRQGKDVAADYLCEKLKASDPLWTRHSFAKAVKSIFCETFQVDNEFLEKWKVVPESPPGFDMPVRQALQFIGDGFRKIQGNIWIELAFRNISKNLILSDVRYLNEVNKINDLNGVTVLLWRPGFMNDDPNLSEAQIKPVVEWFLSTGEEGTVIQNMFSRCCSSVPPEALGVDLFIKNEGTKEDLYKKIDDIVMPFIENKYREEK